MGEREIVNEGQRQLLELGLTPSAVAGVCDVSVAAASMWLSGKRVPGPKSRKKIKAKWGVEETYWRMQPMMRPPVSSADSASTEGAESKAGEIETAREAALEFLELIRDMRVNAARDRSDDILKIVEIERKAINDFAKFNGELTATEESRLTETKRWKTIKAKLIEVLVPHPDAARDVAEALEELGA